MMLLGIVSLSLCVYLFVLQQGEASLGGKEHIKEGHFLFVRKFNI